MAKRYLLNFYCENGHKRSELEPIPYNQTAVCTECGEHQTFERLRAQLPAPYKNLVDSGWGLALAELADVGAIDIAYQGRGKFSVQYPRIADIE